MNESVCIYLRKSRADREAEAHGEGETLARHERILLDLAKKNEYGWFYAKGRYSVLSQQKYSQIQEGE